jgi:hypothetical protein
MSNAFIFILLKICKILDKFDTYISSILLIKLYLGVYIFLFIHRIKINMIVIYTFNKNIYLVHERRDREELLL